MPLFGSKTENGGQVDSLTISSHTVTGTNAALVVVTGFRATGVTVTGIVWDAAGVNEALTKVGNDANDDANAEMWYRAAPTAKTADVTITYSDTMRGGAAALTYTDCDQTNPFRTAAAATANGTDDSPTVDVVALNGELVVDALGQVSAGPDTATAAHTERYNRADVGAGVDARSASQEKASTGATETMSWSMAGAENWATVAAPLQAPVGAVNTRRYSLTTLGVG